MVFAKPSDTYLDWCKWWKPFGCKNTDTTIVRVIPNSGLFIPNVFSPNGDGVNDKFVITGVDFQKFTLKIYNRWGTLLYTSNDSSEGWDGTTASSDKPVSAGTYYFILSAEAKDKDYSRTGSLTLLR